MGDLKWYLKRTKAYIRPRLEPPTPKTARVTSSLITKSYKPPNESTSLTSGTK